MKKLMIMAAIVFAGIVANAAAVTWNTGALYLPNADGSWSSTKASGSTAGTWLTTVTLYADDNGSKGAAITGLTNTSSSTVGGTGTMTATISSDKLSYSTKYWIDAIVEYTSDAGTQTMESLEGYFTTKGSGTTTVAMQLSTVLNQKILGSDVTSFTAVPEPTSGLLLLLGMAGLALRRKRA